ncbi:MAG: DivIVA domain-containing protein [Actinomycetes bacterium]
MALTPDDIRNKRFTAVRFKEGYDLEEVDTFLDEIEDTLTSLFKENSDLRATSRGDVSDGAGVLLDQLHAENGQLKGQVADFEAMVTSLQEALIIEKSRKPEVVVSQDGGDSAAIGRLNEVVAGLRNELATISSQKQGLEAHLQEIMAAQAASGPVNESMADVSAASVRILELAQRTADEHIATARIEAEQLRTRTQAESDTIMFEAKATVSNLTREYETQRVELERKVEELRAYEREYRSRMRSYLEGQLRELESKFPRNDREVDQ